eukprot:PhM_4_TR15270/c0_g1_i3/m.4608
MSRTRGSLYGGVIVVAVLFVVLHLASYPPPDSSAVPTPRNSVAPKNVDNGPEITPVATSHDDPHQEGEATREASAAAQHDNHPAATGGGATVLKPEIVNVDADPSHALWNHSRYQPRIGIDARRRQYHYRTMDVGVVEAHSEDTVHRMTCKALPKAEPTTSFAVELCQSSTGCDGVLKVTKRGRCAVKPHVLDPETAEVVAKDFGPDYYRVRVVGESEVALPTVQQHVADCTYHMPFTLFSEGRYHFEGEMWHENYAHFDEFTKESSRVSKSPLFPRKEKRGTGGVIEGAQHHDPKLNLYTIADPVLGRDARRGRFRSGKNFVWDQFTFASTISGECTAARTRRPTPRCDGTEHGRTIGRWLRYGTAPELPPQLSHTHFERSEPRALYMWTPTRCHLRGYRQEDVGQCLRGKRVAFLGDSHNRATFVHLLNLLTRPDTQKEHDVKHLGRRSEYVAAYDLHLDFYTDVLLDNMERILSSSEKPYDVIIANMGSWAVGGQGPEPAPGTPADYGRWGRTRYARAMDRIASVLAKHAATSSVVWMGTPAYPPNLRRFAMLKGEYRNNARLELYNREAYRAVLSRSSSRVKVVDAYAITLPMVHLSLDHNHFVTYVQDAVLHTLLNVMCK